MNDRASLRQWVQTRLTPVVLVKASRDAEDLAFRNNLRVIDLFRPYSHLSNIDAGIRTTEHSYTLRDFQLRFVSEGEVEAPSPEGVDAHVGRLMTASAAAGDADKQPVIEDKEDVARFVKKQEFPPVWYRQVRAEFPRVLRCSSHEFFDHPVGVINVISTSNTDPLKEFRHLEELPGFLMKGVMDPQLLKFFVVLHDTSSGNDTLADQVYSQVRTTYGANCCRLLRINSQREENFQQKDIWSTLRLPPGLRAANAHDDEHELDADRRPGMLLSSQDLYNLAVFVFDYCSKALLPFMENKIRNLQGTINAARKGFKNQWKLWWGKGSKPDGGAPGGASSVRPAQYMFGSMEAQLRQLADYAFMLRDYEMALNHYRTVAGDFKNDKAWLQYGGAQEMIGWCMLLLDVRDREIEVALDTAFMHYARTPGREGATLALRAAFVVVDLLVGGGRWPEAGAYLLRASADDSHLMVALLQEQAAYCFLRAAPRPMFRKFALYMITAGFRYIQGGQRRHAVRCYAHALSVYTGRKWALVEDHIKYHLGRQHYYLGNVERAVSFFLQLLVNSKQVPGKQSTYLREFITVVKSLGPIPNPVAEMMPQVPEENTAAGANGGGEGGDDAAALSPASEQPCFVRGLPLPAFDDASVDVLLQDVSAATSKQTAPSTPDAKWAAMEASVLNDDPHETLEERKKRKSRRFFFTPKVEEQRCSVVGEEIVLEVDMVNPMRISVDISAVHLVCALDVHMPKPDDELSSNASAPSSPAVGAPSSSSATGTGTGTATRAGPSRVFVSAAEPIPADAAASAVVADAEDDAVRTKQLMGTLPDGTVVPLMEVDTHEMLLAPASKRRMRLVVRPLYEGVLSIKGVHWCLCSQVTGYHEFSIRGKRLNKSKEHKTGVMYGESKLLTVHITGPMPLLDVTLHDLPETMFEGEYRRVELELANVGRMGLKNVKLKLSHPSYVHLDARQDVEPPHAVEPLATSTARAPSSKRAYDDSLLSIPVGVLPQGYRVHVPVWLHGQRAGSHTFRFVFLYEVESTSRTHTNMKHRLLRRVVPMRVVPALGVSTFALPSSQRVGDLVLGVRLHNQDHVRPFDLRQVSCNTRHWTIKPLGDSSLAYEPRSLTVGPNETSAHFFLLSPSDHDDTTTQTVSVLSLGSEMLPPDAQPQQYFWLRAMEDRVVLASREQHQHIRRESMLRRFSEPGVQPWAAGASADVATAVGVTKLAREHAAHVLVTCGAPAHGDAPSAQLMYSVCCDTLMAPPPTAATPASVAALAPAQQPLMFAVQSAVRVEHDFAAAPLCTVPVMVRVRNNSPFHEVSFVFETLPPERHAHTSEESAPLYYSPYLWVGATKRHVDSLAPLAETTVSLRACFAKAGMFDLTRFRLLVDLPGMPPLPLLPTHGKMLTIEAKGAPGK